MLKNNLKIKTAVLTIGAFLLLSAANADAQTRKRRKAAPKPVAAVQPTVYQPTSGDAEIISRADDNTTESRTLQPEPQVVTDAPPGTTANQPDNQYRDLKARVKKLESGSETAYDQKQKRLLLNLDILTRAETRAESLRKQYFEMMEKETDISTKIDQINNDSRPENIDRAVAFAGTLRPEELRDLRAKNLESEKRNLETLLAEIQQNKSNLEMNVQKADQLVEKLRFKLEQDIDDSLADEPKPEN